MFLSLGAKKLLAPNSRPHYYTLSLVSIHFYTSECELCLAITAENCGLLSIDILVCVYETYCLFGILRWFLSN